MQSIANQAEVEAAKTLDVEAAKKAWPLKPRQWYKTPTGANVGFDAYLLAGMHTLRAARRDIFTANESDASMAWLKANAWPIPAIYEGTKK
jgi:hypothetical protein